VKFRFTWFGVVEVGPGIAGPDGSTRPQIAERPIFVLETDSEKKAIKEIELSPSGKELAVCWRVFEGPHGEETYNRSLGLAVGQRMQSIGFPKIEVL